MRSKKFLGAVAIVIATVVATVWGTDLDVPALETLLNNLFGH